MSMCKYALSVMNGMYVQWCQCGFMPRCCGACAGACMGACMGMGGCAGGCACAVSHRWCFWDSICFFAPAFLNLPPHGQVIFWGCSAVATGMGACAGCSAIATGTCACMGMGCWACMGRGCLVCLIV